MSKIKGLMEQVKALKIRIVELQGVINLAPSKRFSIEMRNSDDRYRSISFNCDDSEIVAFLEKKKEQTQKILDPLEQKLNAIEELL